PAISPRFAPTSSAAQLEAAGALWRARPSALMQTHLAENVNEVAWVAELHPDAPDYLGVYQAAGLVGPGANFGHAIHLSARERALLAESGAGISHCPTSNLFIGSGLFDLHGLRAEAPAAPIGLATDVGGGSSFSMFSAMRAAYEIAQLRGRSLHPVQAFHLATLGAAETLRVADRVGALRPGMEADLVLLDPAATPALAQRAGRAESLADLLFALMILGDDRVIRRAYAAGRLIKDRDL
ncbi:MAG: amidohydrolase family protein, partial [Pseudomonadota bacterium]